MALIPPFYLDCVVAIGAGTKRDRRWIASGFFYGDYLGTTDEKRYQVYLVTNRHVVEGESRICIRCNPQSDRPAREFNFPMKGKNSHLVLHPDKSVDVAVIPIDMTHLRQLGMQVAFFESDNHATDINAMKSAGITEGDFAYLLGFPMGLVGDRRNAVIARSGSLARIRDTLDGANKEFLVDALIFPGNSGGPVVSKPEAMAITGTQTHNTANLIGIVRAYVPYQDVAVSQQTGRPRIIFEENSGLATVHPVDSINETIQEALIQIPTLKRTKDSFQC